MSKQALAKATYRNQPHYTVCTTAMLKGCTDLRYIQELLGHQSSKTTEIYTHVSTKKLTDIKSPIEGMDF